MGFQRKPQDIGLGGPGKAPDSHQVPVIPASFCNRQFVPGDVKGRALPPIGRLDLDQAFAAIGLVAGDIEAIAVAILYGSPAHPIGEVFTPKPFLSQPCSMRN